MGDSATAMRDPIFYRWHAYIDDIFQTFKSTLPRYTADQVNSAIKSSVTLLHFLQYYLNKVLVLQLNFPGITVTSCSIESSGKQNNIETFWQQSDVDLSRGMDFQPRGAVFVRFTHLNHRDFQYKIVVNNQSGMNREGTARVFLAPKFDERGNPWLFKDQKVMFIELDKFRVTCKCQRNLI